MPRKPAVSLYTASAIWICTSQCPFPAEQLSGAGVEVGVPDTGVGVAVRVAVAVGAGVGVRVGVGDGDAVGDAVGDGVGVFGLRGTFAPEKWLEDSKAKTVSGPARDAAALATQL